VGFTKENTFVTLPPERAFALWTDIRRWPTFYEGFARVERSQGEWPEEGARLTWQSTPGGRGTVTEKVVEYAPGQRIVTEVFDEALTGRQTARFAPTEEGGSSVQLELDYTLSKFGVLRRITDVLFIRRALTDSLRRTLIRFTREADEEAALG
jgi:uncharacterized protein YndB with AHSA1/START domain